MAPGERVLLKSLSERGGTGKLKSYWENDIYKAVSCHPESPIYQIKPENGGNKFEQCIETFLWSVLIYKWEHEAPILPLVPQTENQKN